MKRKLFSLGEYIEDLKVQKDELEKEKVKQAKIDAVKNEIIKELEKLGEKPLSDTKDIDTDEEIMALRKQLDELKAKVKKEKEKKLDKEKKLAEEKKIKEEKKRIENEIKLAKEELVNELKKLGQDPVIAINEIDSNSDIIALRNQLKEIKDEIKKQKDAKKKKRKLKKQDHNQFNKLKGNIILGETPISMEATNNDEYIAALKVS